MGLKKPAEASGHALSFCQRVDDILLQYKHKKAITYMRNSGSDDKLTFQTVGTLIQRAKQELTCLGLFAGDRVAIISPHSPWAVILGFALAYAGMTMVLIDATIPQAEIESLLDFSDVKAVFTTEILYKRFSHKTLNEVPFFQLDDRLKIAPFNTEKNNCATLPKSKDADTDVIAILYSSGTTGQMKGIMVTYESVLKAREVFVRLSGLKDYMSYLLVLPFNHIAGFTGAMTFFLTGCEMGFIEDVNASKLQNGLLRFQPYYFAMVPKVYEVMEQKIRAALKAKGKLTETLIYTLMKVSGFLRKHFGINIGKMMFHSITSQVFGENIFGIGTGASPCKAETAEFFLNLGLEWANLYATTETSVPIVATGVLDRYPVGTVGNVNHHPEIQVKINHPDQNGIGEVVVKSQLMMKGYFRRPDLTAEAFENGFFKTGDYGYIDQKGNLHLTGRMKESIVLQNGKKVSPADVDEYYLTRIPECDLASRGIAVQNESYDEIDMFVATQGVSETEQEHIRASLEQASRQAPDMYKLAGIYFIPDIPRTSVGKVKRFCLKKEAEQVVHKESHKDVLNENQIIAILQNHCNAQKINMESRLRDDLGLDSLSMFEIVCEIEDQFKADLSTELDHISTVRDLVQALENVSTGGNMEGRSALFDISEFPMKKGVFSQLLFCILAGLSKALWKFEVHGLENIPQNTNYIVCPNHESHLDGLWVWTAMGKRRPGYANICCMAKKEHLESGSSRLWIRMLGGIPVDRLGNSAVSMKRCRECIEAGDYLLIHPEGTRTRNGQMGELKQGAAKLALETGRDLLPVCIQGAYTIYPHDRKWPRI